MSNFDDVKIFMETYGQEIKKSPEFPNKKIIKGFELNPDNLRNDFEENDVLFVLPHQINYIDKSQIDNDLIFKSLPPLIKGYLRLGVFVGDWAIIDEQFNITQFATNWTSIISSMITAVILSKQINNN